MAFCDFCECENCQNGADHLQHAQTEDGRWICDVCYAYDLCTSGPNRNIEGPCQVTTLEGVFCDPFCPHRPKLISEWISENRAGGMFT